MQISISDKIYELNKSIKTLEALYKIYPDIVFVGRNKDVCYSALAIPDIYDVEISSDARTICLLPYKDIDIQVELNDNVLESKHRIYGNYSKFDFLIRANYRLCDSDRDMMSEYWEIPDYNEYFKGANQSIIDKVENAILKWLLEFNITEIKCSECFREKLETLTILM